MADKKEHKSYKDIEFNTQKTTLAKSIERALAGGKGIKLNKEGATVESIRKIKEDKIQKSIDENAKKRESDALKSANVLAEKLAMEAAAAAKKEESENQNQNK